MLKKLVKYGNSYALVLDRSILALLNMDEQSIVRLRIEGDTLLVKAEQGTKITDALMLEVENIHDRASENSPVRNMIEANLRKTYKGMEQSPEAMEELTKWAPGTENFQKMQLAYQEIMKKYAGEMQAVSSEGFQKEVEQLNAKYQGDSSSPEMLQELLALRLKYAPNLAKMDAEMKAVSIEMGYPEQWLPK